MKAEVVPLLRDPGTGEPLEFVGGHDGPWLVSVKSGRRFPIRPVFLEPGDLAGPNGRYQHLYDRFAGLYDVAISALRLGPTDGRGDAPAS